MKRILIINHYWPPTGGACVQRWVDFSFHLAKKGYSVSVLTPENPGFPHIDESLCNRVAPEINVIKVGYNNIVSGSRKSLGQNKITLFVRGNFFLPDARKNWNKHVIRYIEEHINEFDILVTTGPPHSTHLIGLYFKNKLKWIADFHDFWTDALYIKMFNRLWLAAYIDKRFERKVLKHADTVFVHCEKAEKKYRKITHTPLYIIPMGFYEVLFEDDPPKIESKVISHIGSFFSIYSDALETIRQYVDKGYVFRQIGPVEQGVQLPEGTVFIPYVPHREAIEYMRKSELLLLVNRDDFLPGKIFEYLGSQRPIILVSPSGTDAETIVNDNRGKSKEDIFSVFSRKCIASKIAAIIEAL